jgi:hypothetical protein
LFGGNEAGTVHGWDLESGAETRHLSAADKSNQQQSNIVYALALSSDGRTLTAMDDNQIWHDRAPSTRATLALSWDLTTGKVALRLQEAAGQLGLWALAPGGALRASHNGGTQIDVRDVGTGRSLMALDGKCESVWPVAFRLDGGTLAGVCHHGIHRPVSIVLWELATGQEVRRLEVDGVDLAAACSPDGRLLAVGGMERTGLQVWDLATGRQLVRYRGYEAKISALAFSPDGSRLASGLDDGTAIVWDVVTKAGEPKPKDLTTGELERSWDDLAREDAARGQAAVWSLASAPAQAITLIKQLPPVQSPDRERLARLMAELDSNVFAARETAARELQRLGAEAEPALREALQKKPSPEVRRRLESMLSGPRITRLPEALRRLRAVQVLERIGSPEAVKLLEGLSRGAPAAPGTREAKEALVRLALHRR